MRYRIGNRIYDTDKAPCIGTMTKAIGPNATIINLDLHRKKSGSYFLHLSAFDPREQDEVRKPILPLTYRDAKGYAAKMMDDITFNMYFGDGGGSEDEMVQSSLWITSRAQAQLRAKADSLGISISQLICRLADDCVDRDLTADGQSTDVTQYEDTEKANAPAAPVYCCCGGGVIMPPVTAAYAGQEADDDEYI